MGSIQQDVCQALFNSACNAVSCAHLLLNRLSDMQLIRDVMTKAKEAGLNVVRAWATSASPNYALQRSPGNFSAAMFRGLDYALDQARQLNLKVC